jgi:molybdenum cofactor synthesis domain-containing protein
MIRVAVITLSDGVAAGTRQDRSGGELVRKANEIGWSVEDRRIIPDDVQAISALLVALSSSGAVDVILTTGGTGLSPRDVTPEATKTIADREIEGFGELMRSEGAKHTLFAALSRSGAYTRKQVLILNFPGSPKGALESLDAVAELNPHAVDLLHGRTEHDDAKQNKASSNAKQSNAKPSA